MHTTAGLYAPNREVLWAHELIVVGIIDGSCGSVLLVLISSDFLSDVQKSINSTGNIK